MHRAELIEAISEGVSRPETRELEIGTAEVGRCPFYFDFKVAV